jgi:hypothetical protein
LPGGQGPFGICETLFERPAGGRPVRRQPEQRRRADRVANAAGTVIHDFRFEDDWYKATDGAGFSLTVTDPAATDPNALGDPNVWRPSDQPGGTPGGA